LWISILNAAVTAIMALALVPEFATAGAMVSYFCGSVIVGLTGAIIIFRKFRKTRGYKPLLSFDVN
jgi:O-antigen/teichoic acid export membrane protein